MASTATIVFVLFMLAMVLFAVGASWLGHKQDQRSDDPDIEQ